MTHFYFKLFLVEPKYPFGEQIMIRSSVMVYGCVKNVGREEDEYERCWEYCGNEGWLMIVGRLDYESDSSQGSQISFTLFNTEVADRYLLCTKKKRRKGSTHQKLKK